MFVASHLKVIIILFKVQHFENKVYNPLSLWGLQQAKIVLIPIPPPPPADKGITI